MAKSNDYTEQQLANFGKRLREMRIAKGHSNYEHFSYNIDVSRSQYGKYERGGDIRLSTLFDLLKRMDISVAEFFSEGFDGNGDESLGLEND